MKFTASLKTFALIAAITVSMLALSTQATQANSNTFATPFHADSIWNRPIGANPVVDPNSQPMIEQLVANTPYFNIDGIQGAWSVPIYYADENAPFQTVCDASGNEACEQVRIPADMIPSPDGDAKTVVIDQTTTPARAWSFWNLRPGNGGESGDWTVMYGAFGWADISAQGDGLRHYDGGEWGGRVAGWNYIAGLIHPEEIQQGRIDHALAFFIPRTAGKADTFVWPARGTDGISTSPYAIPLGSRIQLDPSLDVDAMNLTPGAKIVARALQQYGGWIADTGESSAVDAREFVAVDANNQPYVDSTPWDGLLTYRDLYDLPLSSFRILQSSEADFFVQ